MRFSRDPTGHLAGIAVTGTSSFGMSGVNAHAIFMPPTSRSHSFGERVPPPFLQHRYWPVVVARHLLGPARAGSHGKLVFACALECQELAYLWDHKVRQQAYRFHLDLSCC